MPRYSATNCWYVNFNNGNVNNNNTYNRYNCVGASDLSRNLAGWFAAEKECFRNKHGSPAASRLHYHPGRLIPLIERVEGGRFTPGRSYCFILTYPVLREIYAAFPADRVVHHFAAPFISSIAEEVHTANGDVSHGNRKGHSAYTAAEKVRGIAARWPYIMRLDFQGFFMSIPRAKAYAYLEECADCHYRGEDKASKLALCKTLITSDPTKDSLYVGDPALRGKIDKRKTLTYAREGCGLPIGNFYSQLVANLYLAPIDALILSFGVEMSRFVDDIAVGVKDARQAQAIRRAVAGKATEMGLTLHPRKFYLQSSHRGVQMCGYTIKGRRIYLNNRTLRACRVAIKTTEPSLEGARRICATVNSYLGFLRHCTEYKNEKRIALSVLEKFGPWVYFREVRGHFVCVLKKRYNQRQIAINHIKEYKNEYQELYRASLRHR